MLPKLYIARTPDGSDFPFPSYTSKHHIGLNLMAAIGGAIKINPGERVRIPIGFAIGIPQGFCGQIISHPKLAEESGIIVSDAPHLLNPADRTPLFVLLQNVSSNQCILHRGDFIAQLLVVPAFQICWQEIQPDIQDTVTNENEILLEPQDNSSDKKKDVFYSFRRIKTSPRNRYKADDE